MEDAAVEDATVGGGALAVEDAVEALSDPPETFEDLLEAFEDLVEAFDDLPACSFALRRVVVAFDRETCSCIGTSRSVYQINKII